MQNERPTRIVVAALIEQDGALFVTQRLKTDSFPGLWEFPGGKVEPEESPEEALVRECREELGIEIEVGQIREVIFHRYDSFCVLLLFYQCRMVSGEPQALQCERIEWVQRSRLAEYPFLPGDRVLIEKLSADSSVREES